MLRTNAERKEDAKKCGFGRKRQEQNLDQMHLKLNNKLLFMCYLFVWLYFWAHEANRAAAAWWSVLGPAAMCDFVLVS